MPIPNKIKEKVRQLPNKPGVYLMRDRLGTVLYIGKAKNLKKRVSSYFTPKKTERSWIEAPKIAAMLSLVDALEYHTVRSETEALLLESQLIKEWRPFYNTQAKDDKRFLLISVEIHTQMPQFRLTRSKISPSALYFGPFVNSQALRTMLQELRKRFGILLGDTQPKKLPNGQYQLYDDVRSELYGSFPNETTPVEYQKRVQEACSHLKEKVALLLEETEIAMAQMAEKRDYKKAIYYRDLLLALRETNAPKKPQLTGLGKSADAALNDLKDVLGLSEKPIWIEGFDISHISGTFTVASKVCFKEGKAYKARYRHYKIRSEKGNDDYQSMEQVIKRAYLQAGQKPEIVPDLILIDGGRGQVNAAQKAFNTIAVRAPQIIGLAKQEEKIVFSDNRPNLDLPLDTPALQLLQRIRDEAHRFANTFSKQLQHKQLHESILDDIPGIGKAKKTLLLKTFKDLKGLSNATAKELQALPGIGERLAETIKAFVNRK